MFSVNECLQFSYFPSLAHSSEPRLSLLVSLPQFNLLDFFFLNCCLSLFSRYSLLFFLFSAAPSLCCFSLALSFLISVSFLSAAVKK